MKKLGDVTHEQFEGFLVLLVLAYLAEGLFTVGSARFDWFWFVVSIIALYALVQFLKEAWELAGRRKMTPRRSDGPPV